MKYRAKWNYVRVFPAIYSQILGEKVPRINEIDTQDPYNIWEFATIKWTYSPFYKYFEH